MYYKMIYDNADDVLSSGKIGEAKVIRIFKTETVEKTKKCDALKATLLGDLRFIKKHQGAIKEMHAKSVGDYRSTIVIIKHENKTLSHLAVNLSEEANVNETFRLEVAGNDGLFEYDSDKSVPIYYGGGLQTVNKKSHQNSMIAELECESDSELTKILDEIMEKIDMKEKRKEKAQGTGRVS